MKNETQKKTTGESRIKLVKGYLGAANQWCLTHWKDNSQKQMWFETKEAAEETLKNLNN